jgi:hypothetical protein
MSKARREDKGEKEERDNSRLQAPSYSLPLMMLPLQD